MTTKTIEHVYPDARIWESKFGPMHTIKVEFTDGTFGELNTKPETEAKRREELTALIDKPGEFTLEDAGNWPDGNPKPLKIKDYPGTPQGSGGGGNGYKALGFAERMELDRFHELSTNARTAVMQALIRHPNDDAAFFGFASRIFDWLQSKAPASPPQSEAGPAGGEGTQEIPSPTSPPAPSSAAGEDAGEGSKPAAGNHIHDFQPAPRTGWVACTICGNAKKAA